MTMKTGRSAERRTVWISGIDVGTYALTPEDTGSGGVFSSSTAPRSS